MNKGSIAQLGTPSDLYEFPDSRFVADFVGSVNMFEGTLIKDKPDEAIVSCPSLSRIRSMCRMPSLGQEMSSVWVAIRPGEDEPAQGCRHAAHGARMSGRAQCGQG